MLTVREHPDNGLELSDKAETQRSSDLTASFHLENRPSTSTQQNPSSMSTSDSEVLIALLLLAAKIEHEFVLSLASKDKLNLTFATMIVIGSGAILMSFVELGVWWWKNGRSCENLCSKENNEYFKKRSADYTAYTLVSCGLMIPLFHLFRDIHKNEMDSFSVSIAMASYTAHILVDLAKKVYTRHRHTAKPEERPLVNTEESDVRVIDAVIPLLVLYLDEVLITLDKMNGMNDISRMFLVVAIGQLFGMGVEKIWDHSRCSSCCNRKEAVEKLTNRKLLTFHSAQFFLTSGFSLLFMKAILPVIDSITGNSGEHDYLSTSLVLGILSSYVLVTHGVKLRTRLAGLQEDAAGEASNSPSVRG